MKGIVFTEFLDMVEDKFGVITVEEIIEQSNLKSEGVYTAVGTYDFGEMLLLVQNLSEKSGINIPDLLKVYGGHFFNVLIRNYGSMVNEHENVLDFLMSIENHIHVEVIKLYSDAELPSFETNRVSENRLDMVYRSSRKLFYFAEGLMNGAFEYFKVNATISNVVMKDEGREVSFSVVIDG